MCLLQNQDPISDAFSVPRIHHCLQPAFHDSNLYSFFCIEKSNELRKFLRKLLSQSLNTQESLKFPPKKEVSLAGVTRWLLYILQ